MPSFVIKTLLMIVFLPLILVNSACSNTLNKMDHPNFTQIGEIKSKHIPEASGLAYSTRTPDVFWTLNDSGHKAEIYALNKKGELIGTVKIKKIKNTDWEDIASFKYDGKSYLLIADVGDNKAKRKRVTLHFIKEPKLKDLSKKKKLKVDLAWSTDFSYEGGPRDCESVGVDTANNKVLLLSKRTEPPMLYQLPLPNHPKKGKQIAKKIMDLDVFGRANPADIRNLKHIAFDGKPTAMDISADGKAAIVLTYLRAFYFHAPKATRSAEVFKVKPQVIELPYLEQAEAISFGKDKQTAYITSEGTPAPLLKIDLTKYNQ